ncbi:MAG: MBL fold metallo-hydrolase [Eggerthellaceae bacterium]|nr:MBL fold metallo-hydrolase [Eggerthellaceae bacterium]
MHEGFDVKQLGEGLWAINEDMVRCFLVVGSERALLIDCCMRKSLDVSQIVAELTDKPVDLVFTHSDPDHTGGQDGFGAPMLHPSEYDHYFARGNTARDLRPLWEGAVLDLGGTSLEAVLVPGHTPGSLAFLDRAHRRIFVGDTVSDAWVYLFSAGRSLQAFIASLKKLEGMAASFDTVYPCHGSEALGAGSVSTLKTAAEKLLAGELVGVDPPRDLPCKAYEYEGIMLLY